MNLKLMIKPLSVNEAWQGKRYKTPEYKSYERTILLMLPKREIKSFESLKLTFGFSNMASDIDNPVKLVLDILQKRYGVNDKDLMYLELRKVIVEKGKEFIEIQFTEQQVNK